MQPYLFPYIGYFHLIMSSDIFVIYDDVNFMKQSYINRNNIVLNKNKYRFTLPVPNSSSNTLIKDLQYDASSEKLVRTLAQAYSKAPYYNAVFPTLEKILKFENRYINHFCMNSLIQIFDYLGLSKKIVLSSNLEYERNASASEKLVSICNIFKADTYINTPGGRDLYNKGMFTPHGINLQFIKPQLNEYKQANTDEFLPGLSIIDVLMNNSIEGTLELLSNFSCED